MCRVIRGNEYLRSFDVYKQFLNQTQCGLKNNHMQHLATWFWESELFIWRKYFEFCGL